ncbi:MAG: Mannosyltransferase OCH1 and related enzymes [uncultured Sulfurovum sp.]|uniref:Mannosyltransferase OCH1 and related enzymes n=1 Tax=uncultured Sulfurovum sp. TaxID=269237 RepID=A0A6S6S5S1_9BACT|nr:MAG: Mannosyltransferase OCH1 and related enzymes [uncultured Sulfurovum sp.]
MQLPIIIVNRLSKLLGAIVKGFSYLFHYIFPKFRFTIPSHRSPLYKSQSKSTIPKIIWQTNFTEKASLPVYVNYLFNRLMGYDYEYRYVSTEARYEFMKEHAPKEVFDAFSQLTNGAAQADLWRVFVLNYYGGVYMDIDAHAVWPLSKMIKSTDKEVFLLNKQHYTNYFIASAKNNPILQKTIDIIVENIQTENIGEGVYTLTGPMTLNRAIDNSQVVNHRFYKVTCIQGSFTNEHFQYLDKPRSKWTYVKNESLLKNKTNENNVKDV